MNLKQHLIEKATIEELNIYDKICEITDRMNEHATNHEYKITFIKTDKQTVTGASLNNPRYDVIVPKACTPETYRQLFIDEFKKMGFDNEDIELTKGENESYTYYNMILRW